MTQDNASPATLSALLARNLDLRGESVAFVEGEREITYREFDGMVRCSAAWLAGQGVKPGDRVAVWLVNRIEWLALYFGLARLGAALMTVNTRYRTHELAYILERSQASLLVLQLNFRKIDFPAVLRDVPLEAALALRKVVVVDAREDMPAQVLGRPTIRFDLAALPDAGMPDADTPDHAAPDSPCVLFTTSGTTSGPKLVVHTQYTATRHSLNVAQGFDLEADGVRLLAVVGIDEKIAVVGVDDRDVADGKQHRRVEAIVRLDAPNRAVFQGDDRTVAANALDPMPASNARIRAAGTAETWGDRRHPARFGH